MSMLRLMPVPTLAPSLGHIPSNRPHWEKYPLEGPCWLLDVGRFNPPSLLHIQQQTIEYAGTTVSVSTTGEKN